MTDPCAALGVAGGDLEGAIAQVLESVGLPPLRGFTWVEPGGHLVGFRWAVLGFEGEGAAGVAVGLSPAAVAAVAEAMTGLGKEDQDDDLMQDVVGELANVLGGNLQPLLSGTTGLCLPSRAAPAELALGPTLRCTAPGEAAPWLAVRLLPRAPAR